jgi:hypothetical protein
LKKAAARAKDLGGSATVYGDKYVGGTHMMYVIAGKPATYAGLQIDRCVPLSDTLWRGILKPVSLLAAGGILVGSFLHYLIHGPKLPDEPGDAGKKEGGE